MASVSPLPLWKNRRRVAESVSRANSVNPFEERRDDALKVEDWENIKNGKDIWSGIDGR
jgi:hypothetical protein